MALKIHPRFWDELLGNGAEFCLHFGLVNRVDACHDDGGPETSTDYHDVVTFLGGVTFGGVWRGANCCGTFIFSKLSPFGVGGGGTRNNCCDDFVSLSRQFSPPG